MATYSPNQLASLAYQAGFRGSALTTAVAVAMAESAGNPGAYNPEKQAGTKAGGGSYGLWQIYLTAHPEFRGVNLYDPLQNAKAAYSVYRAAGNKFTPWSTYNQGIAARYAQSLTSLNPAAGGSFQAPQRQPVSGSQFPVQTIAVSGGGGSAPAPSGGVGSSLVSVNLLPPAVNTFLSSSDFPLTVALIGIGTILVIAGFMMLVGASAQNFVSQQRTIQSSAIRIVRSAQSGGEGA